MPLHQVLVYLVASGRTDSEAYLEMAEAVPLNTPLMRWFFGHYLASPEDSTSSRIALIDADLAGLPPAAIINAELDPLRTDGEKLNERLTAAGVTSVQRTFAGVTHEFFGMASVLSAASDAHNVAASALRAALSIAE